MLRHAFRVFLLVSLLLPSLPLGVSAASQPGDLVKAAGPAVYYRAADGKRYVFPTERTFFTWYGDFSSVKEISDAELAAIPIGGNVTYRPGARLIKVTTDPKVYAVDAGRKLRWVQSEDAARALYGTGWPWMVDDMPDSFFVNYEIGASIAAPSDFSPAAVSAAHPTIQSTLGVVTATANAAGAFGWGSSMDTNIETSSFYGKDHTVSLWFLPQYERSYEGPLVANTGEGLFRIQQGDYLRGGSKVHLYVSYGDASGRFLVPDPVAYPSDVRDWWNTTHAPADPALKWRHLAVVRSGNAVKLYLQGTKLCLDGVAGCADLTVGAGRVPTGALRLGKRVISSTDQETQFYGFIDDLAIFNRALSPGEISSMLQTKRLSGFEAGLVAGYTFDDARGSLQGAPATRGTASLRTVSETRDAAADARILPTPFQSQEYQLPFLKGDVWQVLQGFNSYGSHQGYAAFCWDLMFVPSDAPTGKPYGSQAPTKDRPVVAVAPGVVKEMVMSAPLSISSHILIRHAPNEYSGYLHLALDSQSVTTEAVVQPGQVIAGAADVGASPGGYHLHFAVSNNSESRHEQLVTFPVDFSNYEASDDYGKTWHHVDRGMPKIGQWVRR